MHVVGIELALIAPACAPSKVAIPMLVTAVEIALENRPIGESFDTMPFLNVMHPLPLVGRPIAVRVLPVTMLPVDVEEALVTRPVREGEAALSMLLFSLPLALVDGATFKFDLAGRERSLV